MRLKAGGTIALALGKCRQWTVELDELPNPSACVEFGNIKAVDGCAIARFDAPRVPKPPVMLVNTAGQDDARAWESLREARDLTQNGRAAFESSSPWLYQHAIVGPDLLERPYVRSVSGGVPERTR